MKNFSYLTFGKSNRKVIFFIFGWKTSKYLGLPVGIVLDRYGYKSYIYSYNGNVLDPDNIHFTKKVLKEVADDICDKIDHLFQQGVNDISIIGTSLGSLIALMVANNRPTIVKNIILNTTGSRISDAVWTWDKVIKGFKDRLLSNNVTLADLRSAWSDIEPENNTSKLTKMNRVLLCYAENDEIIPSTLAQDLVKNINTRLPIIDIKVDHSHKHFSTGLLNIIKIKKFVKWIES
jgi:esterase/lipase